MPGQTAPPGERGRPMTPERQALFAQWVQRCNDGENYLKAGRALGLPAPTIWSWWERAKKLGLVTEDLPGAPARRLRPEEKVAAQDLLFRLVVLQGMKMDEAARRVGIGESTAWRWLERRGVTKRQLEEHRPGEPKPYDKLSTDARRGLEDPMFFRQRFLGRTHNPPWAGILFRKLFELFESPNDEYAVVNAPPGIGKSTAITHDFAIWWATLLRAKGQEPTALLGHRSWQKSTWYLKRIRTTLSNNTELLRAYGRYRSESKLAEWSSEEIRIALLEPTWEEKEPTFAAGSYDASVLSGRFKFVVWDDLIDKTNSATADQREKLSDWNENEAESRLEPGGLYLLSNARYGPEDLSFTVTQQVDEEDVDQETQQARPLYNRIRFRAHDETKCPAREGNLGYGERSQIHDGPWPDGCLLDPERVTWRRIRRQLARDEGRYLLVWQQEDIDPKGNLAERAWFEGGKDSRGALHPGCFDPERGFGQLRYRLDYKSPNLSAVSVDPSSSKYWGIGHFLVYDGREQVLHRGVRRPMQAPDLLYVDEDNPGGYVGLLEEWWQASLAEGVPFHYLIMEANAAQKYALQYPFFTRWAASRDVAIIPHTTTINKTDKDRGVEMLRPVYQFGRVKIPYLGYEERLFADQFRREACAWPEGQTSDLVMMHWFFVHRMDALVATEFFEATDEVRDGIPEWAQQASVPAWAGELKAESLDREATLLRR